MIIYAPAGAGKTLNSEELCKFFNKNGAEDLYLDPDKIYFVQQKPVVKSLSETLAFMTT